MRYFLYHHDVEKDSFWGMPKNMLGEWNGKCIRLYSPDGSSFTINSTEPGIESSIVRGELGEMDAAEFAKYLLTTGSKYGNRWLDRLSTVH